MNPTKKLFYDLFGWYGVVAILTAYAFNVFQIISSSSTTFLWLNLTGSAGIILVSWQKRAYQPMTLNIVWLVVAAIGLFQLLT